nr:hypothetical protein [Tanacetum cinerariifolium]
MCGLANSERILFYLMLLPNLDAGISKVGMIAKLLKQTYIQDGGEECVMSTQEYIKNVLEDVGDDGDFKRGSWVSVIEYVNANGGIMSGCLGNIKNFFKNKCYTLNVLGNLKVTLKDLSDTIGGSIHHRVVDEEGYGKDITVFRKDTEPKSDSGIGESGMLNEKEIIKLLEEMVGLELQVYGNVTDQEDQYKLDEEALNLILE